MELNRITCLKNVKISNQLKEMNDTFNEYISIFKAFVQNNKNIHYEILKIFKTDVINSSSRFQFK